MAAPTNAANVKKALANSEPSTHGTKRTCPSRRSMSAYWGRAEVRDAREATTAIGANAKTLVFASTTNTAPEELSGSLRRTATTLRGDTVQRLPRATVSWRRNSRISRCPRCL